MLITQQDKSSFKSAADLPLTDEQKAFVSDTRKVVTLIAPAGSGKTTVLLQKLKELACHSEIRDLHLCIISHSNSAADNFSDRFVKQWDGFAGRRIASTLHSWARKLLWKEFEIHETRVDHMITRATSELAKHPRRCNEMFETTVLLVDEAQDCTEEQWQLLHHLRDRGCSIYLVGDPRQSIYGFAGVTPSRIFHFGPVMHLTQNFRSTKAIVRIANTLFLKGPLGDTGLEYEVPDQLANTDVEGDLPVLCFVDSLAAYHLSDVVKDLRDGQQNNKRQRVAHDAPVIITYSNADVHRLHQSLFFSVFAISQSCHITANSTRGYLMRLEETE